MTDYLQMARELCVPAVMAATTDAGLSHPAARAVHAVLNAAQIARGLATPGDDGGSLDEDGEQIVALLTDAAQDIAALHQNSEAKGEEMAELRAELCAMAQRIVALEAATDRLDTARVAVITELRSRLAGMSRDVEHLYLGATMDLARHTDRFNAIRRVREQLDPALRTDTTDEPRAVAAGVL